MDPCVVLSRVKHRLANGCRNLCSEAKSCLRRRTTMAGCAYLMQECACCLAEEYSHDGYVAQRFQFHENGIAGDLVQIGKSEKTVADDALQSVVGQKLAVNVRFMPIGADLEVLVDSGRWLDKAFSGMLAWAVFAPLIVLPMVGAYRQKRLLDRVEHSVANWLQEHYRAGIIDVEA